MGVSLMTHEHGQSEPATKWTENWEGDYELVRVISPFFILFG
jgi:hypothetical protein